MADTTQPLLCIHCGYDLRGTPGHVCSECGKEFDPENHRPSLLPWEHVNFRAFKYLRTVYTILFGRGMANEATRDHLLQRAKRFRLKTCLETGFVLLLAYFGPMLMIGVNPGGKLIRMSNAILDHRDEVIFLDKFLHEFYAIMGLGLQGVLAWIIPLIVLPLLAREWVFAAGDSIKRKTKNTPELECYLAAFPAFVMNWSVLIAGLELICYATGIMSPIATRNVRKGSVTEITDFVWLPISLLALGAFTALILAAIRSHQWLCKAEEGKKASFAGQLTWLAWTYLWRTFFWLIFIPCFAGVAKLVFLGLFRWQAAAL